MRTISFNKHKFHAKCLVCKRSKVEPGKELRPCSNCRRKGRTHIEEPDLKIGKALPAAVVKAESGEEIYVDKFGNKVDNPGYDLKRDPRGWKHTGTAVKQRTII